MTKIINLFPTVRRSREHLIEDAVEEVETLGATGTFNINMILGPVPCDPRRYGAATQTLRNLERAGLIRRVSRPRARPTQYVLA